MRTNKTMLIATAGVLLLGTLGAVAELDCPVVASGGSSTSDGSVLVVGQVIIGDTGANDDLEQGAVPCWVPVPGDLNCDGVADFDDINPFVILLSQGLGAYNAAFPDCDHLNGDLNDDGIVDFDDINPFVLLLTGA